jgi:uncharacterized protein YgbK (DUF1537 family)
MNPADQIRREVRDSKQKIVVLDDDPTGTQTVYDVPVLADWSIDALAAELANDLPVFYILTNSRSVSLAQAREWNLEIARNLRIAAGRTGRRFVVVSRSDSTLRGHFPGEVEALIEGLDFRPDGILLIPFFPEGGRFTVGDIHYVADGDCLIPAAETEFARDPVFGYRHSNLHGWVEEKTQGRTPAHCVRSISLDTIRCGGPEAVAACLDSLSDAVVCIVNAFTERDLAVFTAGLLAAEHAGKQFLYRTAASFVASRCGLEPRQPVTAKDLELGAGGGLIIAGSFVPKTTAQINMLLAETDTAAIELEVQELLEADGTAHVASVVDRVAAELLAGRDVVVHTSRNLVAGTTTQETLEIGKRISESVVEVVRSLPVRPRYLLAKGGITSSDIATEALGVRRAMVKGQILPGVPVWQLGPESRHPNLPYIVFPGNVGDSRALLTVVRALANARAAEAD